MDSNEIKWIQMKSNEFQWIQIDERSEEDYESDKHI